jgi:hypothetical protein
MYASEKETVGSRRTITGGVALFFFQKKNY